MAEVKWHENNREMIFELAKKTGKANKRYYPTTLSDILLNWDVKEDVKYIKVSFGKGNWIEFDLYSSGPYLTYLKKSRKSINVVEGKFFLVVRNSRKIGPTANEILSLMESIDKSFNKLRLADHEHWVDLDTMNERLLKIEEFLEDVDAYKVMDELSEF